MIQPMETSAGKQPTAGRNDQPGLPCQTPPRCEGPTCPQKPAGYKNATPCCYEAPPTVHRAPPPLLGNGSGGKYVLVAPVLKPPRSEPPVPRQRTPRTVPGCVRGPPGTDLLALQLGPRTGHLITMERRGRPNPLATRKEVSSSRTEPPEGQNYVPEHGSPGCPHGPSSPQQSDDVPSLRNGGDGALSSAGTVPDVQNLPKGEDASSMQTLRRTKADQARPQTQSAPRVHTSPLGCPTTSGTKLRNSTYSTSTSQSRASTKSCPTDTGPLRPPIKSCPTDTGPLRPPIKSCPTDTGVLRPPTKTCPTDTGPLRPPTKSCPTDTGPLRPPTKSCPTDTGPLRPPTKSCPTDTGPLRPSTVSCPMDTGPLRPPTKSCPTDTGPLRPPTKSCPTDSGPLRPPTKSCPMDTGPLRPSTESSPSDTGPLRPSTESSPSDTGPLRPSTKPSPTDTGPLRPSTKPSPTDTGPLRLITKTSLITDSSQLRPTAQSALGKDSIHLRSTTRSPPRTNSIHLRPITGSPKTDSIHLRSTTRSPPRTDSIHLRSTTRSPPRTDSIHLRSTTRSPPRTDSIHLRSTTRSPPRSTKSQKTERRSVKLLTEAPLKPPSGPKARPGPGADSSVMVCDPNNEGKLLDSPGTPCARSKGSLVDPQSVAKHEKMQNRLDGGCPSPRSNGTPRKTPHPEEDDVEDSGLFIPVDEEHLGDEKKKRKRLPGKKRRENRMEDDTPPVSCDLDQDLERALEDGAKQHNLTAVNVRNILHEVITNEHVVAMMKAAITETEGLPPFEPKMTRSKLKEVVEKGVVIPTWNLSPIKKANKVQAPQFVDIPLEEEDSSDEEYQPDEEEEDETAEESLLESDVESTASSPRGHRVLRAQQLSESPEEEAVEAQNASRSAARHIFLESVPMGPPPPPKVKHSQDSTFMEKLHAVEEELDRNLVTMDSFQSLDESLIAFRTRSKRPLKDVPIGQLEAELRAPDITPDMYDHSTADDEYWKMWLCSLMQDDVGNEDEGDDDDDDDPEYNILEDWDEPDTEDLRNDRAVRITKKEVNELMEELFETFQDEMGLSQLEDEGPDDEDSNSEPLPDFNTPQAIRFEEPLANLLTEQHRTVRAQLEYLRMRKSIVKSDDDKCAVRDPDTHRPPPAPKAPPVLALDAVQRRRLQQQMQQHVQLLTQLHLLTFRNPELSDEAETAQMFLVELSSFAESSSLSHQPGFQSAFHPCNLQEALQLIPLVDGQVPEDPEPPKPARKNGGDVSDLAKHMAWVMATRPVFMYPELLPLCSMRARGPRDRVFFTKAEDGLLALGLKHFEGTELSKQLISKYLLTAKTAQQLTVRIKNLTMKKSPDNVIKYYKKTKMVPPLSRCCEDIPPQEVRPPVEREKHRLPFWIKASLSSIEAYMTNTKSGDSGYPLLLPPAVAMTLKPLPRRFYRRLWRQKRSVLKPLLIRPPASTTCTPKLPAKPVAPQTVPIRIISQVPPLMQPAVPVQGIVNLQPVGVPLGRKGPEICNRRTMCTAPSAIPVPQTRVIMPATSNPRIRKSLLGGIPRIKTVPRTAGVRGAPLVHSAPVLFAVPNGALKLVSLGPPCRVLQPVSAVLLNPAHVPLSQALIPPPYHQIQKTVPMGTDLGGGCSTPRPEIKEEEDDGTVHMDGGSPECAGEGSPDGGGSDGAGDQSPSEDKPPKESERSSDDLTGHVTDNDDKPVDVQGSPSCGGGAPCPGQMCAAGGGHPPPWEGQNSELSQEETPPKQEEEEPEDGNEPQKQESGGGATDSPKNTSPSTDGDLSSPSAAPPEASSPPAGQDLTNDKDPAEEEEEEDFDDLTQDEDEMSSASEESVLSVPELQETMEKLTWLASERRLSQEADSEENSQEENTEEEEEEDAAEVTLHKAEEMTDEAGEEEGGKLDASHLRVPSPAPVETNTTPAGERRRTGSKGPGSHRVRNRRGRTRASKDASKLLLLYDEKILLKDPLREQKDMAYARSYLNRVREALQAVPGTYEQFLNIIYEFETSSDKRTAVHLYEGLQHLLQDWPQLLKDFAAFLLPEQALECGLFEEQQAFEKSRRFLRQLEICFKENPAHHQKIIRVLQSCAECPLQEIAKLKAQMWQLLKGHHHLQEEFSLFFDQLRPPASRMEDFEVMNWTEEKEYKFDGFEEVTLPEVDEEEEPNKAPPTQRNKRRKEAIQDKDVDWPEGGKDCPCSCHDGGAEQRLKRCKRRLCSHCSSKACENRAQRPADAFRQNSAGDGRSLLKSSAEERTSAGTAHRSRSTLHGRGITENPSKPRTQPKENGRSTLRGARRPHASKDSAPALTEKESECSPRSHSDPCTPNSVENPGTPAEGATRCHTPTASLCEPNLPAENSALQPTDREEQTLTVCAKNIRLSSSGEKVIVWTREADRVILTMCQERGAHEQTFTAISEQLGNKSPSEVAQRFRELVSLFQTGCVTSSDEEEEEEDPAVMENMSDPEAAQSEDD